MKIVPASAFSGRPRVVGGAERVTPRPGPRRSPGRSSRSRASPCTRRACGTAWSSRRCSVSQRVFQKIWLPLKNARFTPASRAASTFARWLPDQYSSWPTDMNTLCCSSMLAGARSVSMPLMYDDVVAVGLEPADHRVLGVEERVLGRRAACRERPVVTDLVRAVRVRARTADVEAVPAVVVVRLPRRIRRLEQQVRVAGVVADHERDLARAAAYRYARELGEVDTGDRVDGTAHDADSAQFPQSTRPVAASLTHAGCVCGSVALGLTVAIVARAVAAVVPDAVDVDLVRRRVGVDLEVHRLTGVRC